MRFRIIAGPVFSVTCQGCQEHKAAGSDLTASGRTADTVYVDLDADPVVYYCEACATKHAEGIDPTKSVTKFFADTQGEEVL